MNGVVTNKCINALCASVHCQMSKLAPRERRVICLFFSYGYGYYSNNVCGLIEGVGFSVGAHTFMSVYDTHRISAKRVHTICYRTILLIWSRHTADTHTIFTSALYFVESRMRATLLYLLLSITTPILVRTPLAVCNAPVSDNRHKCTVI